MSCFMFPGPPFSLSGTMPDNAEWSRIARLVRVHGHFDLADLSWIGEEGSLQVALQLRGLARSLYQLHRLRCDGVEPSLVAQHGMGIYPALVACGCIEEAQAIELAWLAGSCLSGMGSGRKWAQANVVGLPLELLQPIADGNRVFVAHHNTSHHFLVSGAGEDIERAAAEAMAAGAVSARSFACDAPLHTPLLEELEEELSGIFAGFSFRDPTFPLINHLNQAPLGAGEISWFLLRHLQLPVYWERTYRAVIALGATRFFELGEGDELQTFGRWMDLTTTDTQTKLEHARSLR